jgi:FkbM family methyltransferase
MTAATTLSDPSTHAAAAEDRGTAAAGQRSASPAAEPEAWVVATSSGLHLRLPPSMRSLTTYVMLEQERWFEPEMSLLPLLLAPASNALDIGANHGIYTLEIARCAPAGRILAFEPTSAPRQRLCQSVREAGLDERVTVVDAGLADVAGEAHFAVHDNSELNSREGVGERRERVRLETLDEHLEAHAPELAFDFVKLDAEGDELHVLAGAQRFFARQSPVVLFEYKHGREVNAALLGAWPALGYGLFRWSAELELLLPFDATTAEAAFALNLVAVRPAQQAALAARGLLVTADAAASTTTAAAPEHADDTLVDALNAWCSRPAFRGQALQAPASSVYTAALADVVSAHLGQGLSALQRLAALQRARDLAMVTLGDGGSHGPQLWVLLVHCLHALGEQNAAVQLGRQVLAQWPAGGGDINEPVVPPLRGDLERPCSTALGPWLRQVLAEFVATHNAYSSYFQPAAPERWGALLNHPDHAPGIERRYLLSHVMCDRVAPVDRLHRLNDPRQTRNHFLWQGLIKTMAAMAPGAGVAPPVQRTPAEASAALLAGLPVGAVTVVDVGASSLAHEAEPYAPLVAAGRARVTGFEPDAQALHKLQQSFPDGRTHRYLPHFVGDGGAAVFHETEWSLTASLLAPNRPVLDRYQQLGALVQPKAMHAVLTVRLDEVIEPGGMDLLKIDVQGAERLVFDGAPERLAECLVVWTEVEMLELYRQQPLFGDIDATLRRHGLQFLCFTGLATRPLASWPAGLPAPRRQQQLWADAIYVPSPERIAALPADAAARLALLAHHVVEAGDLCHAALLRLDELTGSDFAPRYVAALRGG